MMDYMAIVNEKWIPEDEFNFEEEPLMCYKSPDEIVVISIINYHETKKLLSTSLIRKIEKGQVLNFFLTCI